MKMRSASKQPEERERADNLHRAIAGTANYFERKKVTTIVGHDVLGPRERSVVRLERACEGRRLGLFVGDPRRAGEAPTRV